MSRTHELLSKLGLDTRESQIYLYLLKTIESTAYKIGKDLSIQRPTVYAKLDNLKRQGLISSFRKNNVLHFTPESIRALEERVEAQSRAFKELSPILREIVDSASLHGPKTYLYEGKEGARKVWEFVLEIYERDSVEKSYATTHSALFEQFPKYFNEWIERRRRLQTSVHLLNPESDRKNIGWTPTTEHEQVRYIPDDFLSTGEIVTFGKYTAMFSFEKHNSQSIIIESKFVTDMIERLLKFAWKMAKE